MKKKPGNEFTSWKSITHRNFSPEQNILINTNGKYTLDTPIMAVIALMGFLEGGDLNRLKKDIKNHVEDPEKTLALKTLDEIASSINGFANAIKILGSPCQEKSNDGKINAGEEGFGQKTKEFLAEAIWKEFGDRSMPKFTHQKLIGSPGIEDDKGNLTEYGVLDLAIKNIADACGMRIPYTQFLENLDSAVGNMLKSKKVRGK